MAQSNKKSLSQKAVSVGTMGMPKPVRKFLSGRIIASLIVLAIPVLFATGLVSVTWKNGFPKLSINQQKAGAIKEQASQKIQELRGKNNPHQPPVANPLQSLSNQATSQINSAADRKSDESLGQKSAGLIRDLSNGLK